MIDVNQYIKGASPYNDAYALKYEDGDYSLEANPPVIPHLQTIFSIPLKMGKLTEYRF